MAIRRLQRLVLVGILALVGIVAAGCSSSKTDGTKGAGTQTTQDGKQPAAGDASGGGGGQTQEGQVKGASTGPAADGNACDGCQSSKDGVKLSDKDGFTFETGEAEAGYLNAEEPTGDGGKPVTFDGGQGTTGTTGSANLNPKP